MSCKKGCTKNTKWRFGLRLEKTRNIVRLTHISHPLDENREDFFVPTHISHPSDENREDFFASMWNESLTHKECKGVCPPWMFKFVRFMTVPI